jgi:hypothetical protein
MKRQILGIVGAVSCLLALAWSSASIAQGNCGDIEFTGEVARQLPNAADACLDIVERDGRPYAHFEARIVRASNSEVVAEFRRPDGSYGDPVSFTPPSDARVRIQGRSYRYRDLARGQELDVYMPPDRWEIAVYQEPGDDVDFESAAAVTPVALQEPSPQVAAALPRTASPLPLVALLGLAFTALGAAVAGLRYRLRRKA